MSNIKNNIKLKGIKVENAVRKIIEDSTNALFLVEGDAFRGNISSCPNANNAKFESTPNFV